MWAGVCKTSWGLWRIVSGVIFGIASVFVFIGKKIEAFCRREFAASLIIGSVAVIMIAAFTLTFVKERSMRISAEMQRDSLSYVLDRNMVVFEHREQ